MNGNELAEVGLMRPRPLAFLLLWYFFSFTTILLNKHILSTLEGDPILLANTQVRLVQCSIIFHYFKSCMMLQN